MVCRWVLCLVGCLVGCLALYLAVCLALYLERRVRFWRCPLLVGVPGGRSLLLPGTGWRSRDGSVRGRRARWKGKGPPGTEGENWDGSVRGGCARWKGKVFQVERKVEYGYGRSFYRFTQIMAIRNNGSPRFRIRYKGFESVFFSGTSYSSCFCRARCRS